MTIERKRLFIPVMLGTALSVVSTLSEFGGVAPLPEVGVSAQFGILGGTGDFRKAKGEGILVVTELGVVDTILTLK